MSYRAGDVRPGKCFVTGGDTRPQVRRVCSLAGAVVVFERRDPKSSKRVWSGPVEISMEQFLSEAVREVGSDYTG